jgi:hypothetical protein
MKRKFAYQHPLFGHTKEQKELGRYRTTVYYLWWEFLRRSDAYREFCSYAGTKEPSRFSALYEDFGDVFSTDFNVWWRTGDRGANLFAERLPPNMQVLTEFPDATTAGQVLVVQVPLALSKRKLAGEFQKLMTQYHLGRRGVRNTEMSSAKYPVTGHIDTIALKKCLDVYDMKTANPKMRFWEVAQKCKAIQGESRIKSTDSNAEITNKKLILSNTTNRLLKKAKMIIQNVENGRFAF